MQTPGCRLEVCDLAKSYGSVTAADGVDLDLAPGELLTLLGPSGCGKTTVLQAIAGFVLPDRGDIRLDGASLLAVPPERRETAMLFQHYALFPHMNVRENVGFGPRMRGVPRAEAARSVAEALDLVRVPELAERYPRQLSGGQRQRVALARAVVTRPRVLLLDEPFGALDQNLRDDMQVELRKLQQRLGITTLIVTHDQKEALVLSDRIAVMRAGRVEQVGSPVEIYDRPRTRFVAQFMGVENILPAMLHGDGSADIAGLRVAGFAGAGPAEVAIRAEAIALAAPVPGRPSGMLTFSRVIGAAVRSEVAAPDGTVLTVVQPRGEADLPQPGEAVSIAVAAARCTLLWSA